MPKQSEKESWKKDISTSTQKVDFVAYCQTGCIALRGLDETKISENSRNFLIVVKLSDHVPYFNQKLREREDKKEWLLSQIQKIWQRLSYWLC